MVLKEKAKTSVKEKLKVESLIHLIRQIEFSDEPGEPDDPAPVDSEFESKSIFLKKVCSWSSLNWVWVTIALKSLAGTVFQMHLTV